MKRQVLGVLVACAAAVATAQPRKIDVAAAEKFRRDLRAAVDQGFGVLGGLAQQKAHSLKLAELEQRSTRLFGDVFNPGFGSCVKSATYAQAAWTERVFAAERPTPLAMANVSRLSFEAGLEYWVCRTAIDDLAPAAKTR